MTEKEDDAGYYAIIPASVRYDKTVPSGAKLLYGEITALYKKKGYCWSKNSYFAGLYDTSERTIIEWINRLREAGHIRVIFSYFLNSKKIAQRFISIIPLKKKKKQNSVVKKTSPLEFSESENSDENITNSEQNMPVFKEFSECAMDQDNLVVKKTA